jgi:hypothetical protein
VDGAGVDVSLEDEGDVVVVVVVDDDGLDELLLLDGEFMVLPVDGLVAGEFMVLPVDGLVVVLVSAGRFVSLVDVCA